MDIRQPVYDPGSDEQPDEPTYPEWQKMAREAWQVVKIEEETERLTAKIKKDAEDAVLLRSMLLQVGIDLVPTSNVLKLDGYKIWAEGPTDLRVSDDNNIMYSSVRIETDNGKPVEDFNVEAAQSMGRAFWQVDYAVEQHRANQRESSETKYIYMQGHLKDQTSHGAVAISKG